MLLLLEPHQSPDALSLGPPPSELPRVLSPSEPSPLSPWCCVRKFGVRGLAGGLGLVKF